MLKKAMPSRALEYRTRLTPKAMRRFWAKVEKLDSGCWRWMGSADGAGYGTFSLFGRNNAAAKAHRVSWIIANGAILDARLHVCHKCDNPPCVNPSHLFLGTPKENAIDCSRKGRSQRSGKGRCGELNNSAKLRNADIPHIWRLIKLGMPCSNIGVQFGVSRSCISNIKRKKNHVLK